MGADEEKAKLLSAFIRVIRGSFSSFPGVAEDLRTSVPPAQAPEIVP
jgi:hypothetical protein